MPKYSGKKRKTELATKEYVKKVVAKNIELKHYTQSFSAEAVSTSGFLINLGNMPQGVQDYERIGNKIRCHKIMGRMIAKPSFGDGNNEWRWSLVRQREPVVIGDFPNFNQPFDYDKFEVIIDEMAVLHATNDGGGTAGDGINGLQMKIDLSCYNKLTRFDSSSAGDVINGGYFIYMISDSSAINHPGFTGYVTLHFRDA